MDNRLVPSPLRSLSVSLALWGLSQSSFLTVSSQSKSAASSSLSPRSPNSPLLPSQQLPLEDFLTATTTTMMTTTTTMTTTNMKMAMLKAFLRTRM